MYQYRVHIAGFASTKQGVASHNTITTLHIIDQRREQNLTSASRSTWLGHDSFLFIDLLTTLPVKYYVNTEWLGCCRGMLVTLPWCHTHDDTFCDHYWWFLGPPSCSNSSHSHRNWALHQHLLLHQWILFHKRMDRHHHHHHHHHPEKRWRNTPPWRKSHRLDNSFFMQAFPW